MSTILLDFVLKHSSDQEEPNGPRLGADSHQYLRSLIIKAERGRLGRRPGDSALTMTPEVTAEDVRRLPCRYESASFAGGPEYVLQAAASVVLCLRLGGMLRGMVDSVWLA